MRNAGTMTAVALVLGLAAAFPVLADDTHKVGGSADTNQDTWIDANEAMASETQSLRAFDKNGDGFVSRDEYLEHGGSWLTDLQKKRAASMATAGAGLPARDDAAFGKIDADKDTKLSLSEYMHYGKTQFEAGSGSAGMIGADKYGTTLGVQSFNPAGADTDMDKSVSSWEAASDVELDFGIRDKNADNIISKEEWQAELGTDVDKSRWETRFSALDADKDGRLSPAELGSWRSMKDLSGVKSVEPAAGTEETTTGSDTTEQSAAKPDDQDGKWSAWTFRRYYFY